MESSVGAEPLELEVEGIQFRPEINVATAHENPPDYNVSGVPESDVSPLDDECDLPPLDYDTVMSLPAGTVPTVNSDETEQPKGSIIAEAPPSYRDIFGSKTETAPQTKRWRRTQRPHTLSRRQHTASSSSSNPNGLNRLFSCLPSVRSRILIVSTALFILVLPLSMVTVGSLNINICSTKDIPLYLIIAGSCLSVEVLIHTFTILASMNTDNESVLRSLRMCDCFAFFILIWILIGSNWIFKVSVNSKSCIGRQDTENELLFNQLDNSTDLLPDVTTPRTCEDCSNSVYQFAVGLIVLQYIVVFLVFVACCCVAIRKGAH